MSSLQPRNAREVTDAVAWALDHETPLEVLGGGSKRGLGRPSRAEHRLDLSGLRGITLYEPEELVLTASPGTPLEEVEAVLAQRRQMLAFEPPALAALYGEGRPTLGGIVACNLSGPRRISAGAARDHFLGFQATTGRAERIKSGGRVMKNVTGYDLSKLMAGSYGTLGVLDEITLKVLPAPEKTRTVLLPGLDDVAGVAALCKAMGEPVDVSGAAFLPADIAVRSSVDYVRRQGGSVAALRLEGPGPSVEDRCRHLRAAFAGIASEELHSANSTAFWREVRELSLLSVGPDRAVWKLSLAPTEAPATLARIRADAGNVEAYYDWSGGLVFVSLDAGDDCGVAIVRGARQEQAGHATLLRAPDAFRAAIPAFHPQPPALAALSARVKEAFDPKGILNPGRMR
ncbi:MAG: glycolate oxidase subunit GlcE [Reyranellaceae bacterium]